MKFTKKEGIILGAIFILAIAGGGIWALLEKQKTTVTEAPKQEASQQEQPVANEPAQPNNQEQVSEDVQPTIDTSDWKTYRNEEYGFEIKLPGVLEKWQVKKQLVPQEQSVHNSNDEVILYFNYQLDKEVARVENDHSMGMVKEMTEFYIKIIPTKDWSANACKGDRPMALCRQGNVLGVSEVYVFEMGFPNVEGAGYICADSYESQQEFCTIYNEVSKSIDTLVPWKFIVMNE